MHDPVWLDKYFGIETGEVLVYFLYQGEALRGFAAFVKKYWPVKWQLGEITLAKLPLRRLCLLGGRACFPEDPAAYGLLFRALSRENDFDALFMEAIEDDCLLWQLIKSDANINRAFSRYVPDSPRPRVLLRCEGTFQEYLEGFSSKHRKNLVRMWRKFLDATDGQGRWVRVVNTEEVDSFVDQAIEVSRKTYQWNLLGLGLGEPDNLKEKLSFVAGGGWLRSYLLLCKDVPCAFIVAFQYGARCYLQEMGYDPRWRAYSVGKILHLKLIEDLFTCNRPNVYDLGEYATHKQEFGTECSSQGQVFLFRPGAYGALVRAGDRACRVISQIVSGTLERCGLKGRLKRSIRKWGRGS
jgi:hypothetical protein